MEHRLLRYFVAVAEELHFGRAAERVHIAQPPFSQQIRKLEEELGVQLLIRTKRKVVLTEAGRFLLDSARLILRQTDAAVAGVRAAGRGLIGRLVIGLVNGATFQPLVFNVLLAFRQQSPGVAIDLKVMTSAEQIRAIHHGEIGVGFVRSPVRDNSIVLEPILSEELVVALPLGHRLAEAKSVNLSDLAQDHFVMPPRHAGFGLADSTLKLCQQAGFNPTISQDASDLQTITGLVAARFGVSLVPSSAKFLPRPGVVYKSLRPARAVALYVAYSKGNLPPVLKTFLQLLRETIVA